MLCPRELQDSPTRGQPFHAGPQPLGGSHVGSRRFPVFYPGPGRGSSKVPGPADGSMDCGCTQPQEEQVQGASQGLPGCPVRRCGQLRLPGSLHVVLGSRPASHIQPLRGRGAAMQNGKPLGSDLKIKPSVVQLLSVPVIPPLGVYPRKQNRHPHGHWAQMPTAALVLGATWATQTGLCPQALPPGRVAGHHHAHA